MSDVLAIIPARGGSKGIKDKNIYDVLGKPLIQYTIDEARKCTQELQIVCSTDSERIAAIVRTLGISCDDLRPAHLASDEANTSDVIRHEIIKFEKTAGKKVKTVLVLQPTSPLRTARDIDLAIKKFQEAGSKSLISCYENKSVHPSIMYFQNNDKLVPVVPDAHRKRRQEFGKCFVRNGAIYLVDRDFFMETSCLFEERPALYEMSPKQSLNIDEPADIEQLTRILSEKNQNR